MRHAPVLRILIVVIHHHHLRLALITITITIILEVSASALHLLLRKIVAAFHQVHRRLLLQLLRHVGNLQLLARLLPLQQFFEFFDLFRVLFEQGVFGVFVDFGLVFDVLGTRGVTQSAQCLVVIIVGWTDCCNHDGFCVTA